jgi:hypothetical protein
MQFQYTTFGLLQLHYYIWISHAFVIPLLNYTGYAVVRVGEAKLLRKLLRAATTAAAPSLSRHAKGLLAGLQPFKPPCRSATA